MKVVLLIIVFGVLALIDLPKLYKKKQWKDLSIYTAILSMGFILSLLLILGVKVPNPNKAIISITKMIFP